MSEISEKINNSIESEATTLERLELYVINTPEKTAFVYQSEERITFRELWEISGKIYAWLKAKGIGAEDVILYSLPRGILLYACMVGTMRAGAAFVLTETENDPKRTAYIKKNSGCSLYVDEECMKEIMKGQPLEGYEPVNRRNLCYIAYTSGTTGEPCGIQTTARNTVLNIISTILGMILLSPYASFVQMIFLMRSWGCIGFQQSRITRRLRRMTNSS